MNVLSSPLLTDLYQLAMLDAYRAHRMSEVAVFELFVRRLPQPRNFLVAAGLAQVLDYLGQLRFSDEDLEWVRASGRFSDGFAEYLAGLRFTGDVHAMPEGTVFFAEEPVLRITAPLPEAQLVESRLINLIQLQSMIASKAARCVLAAPGRQLVDFGFRRAHGAEAGVLAARATYLMGFAGTATVIAGAQFGIPLFGTMAHSFVQAHDDELEAFRHFAQAYPAGTTLLIDTYDAERAAHKVVELCRGGGVRVSAVRLDSGDLAALAGKVRTILDAGGLGHVRIFASGNLDEYRVRELLAAGAPIDGFGIGTSLDTSADAPSLDAVYKLQEYAGAPRRKRSTGKSTWPGRKQVFRQYDNAGRMVRDVVSVEGDACEGEPLLVQVMAHGRPTGRTEPLADARSHALRSLDRLPAPLRTLEPAPPYPVEIAPALRALAETIDKNLI